MRALSALTLPAFTSDLLADTQPYAFFDDFFGAPARARFKTHVPCTAGVCPLRCVTLGIDPQRC
jgi:hypothetical protein